MRILSNKLRRRIRGGKDAATDMRTDAGAGPIPQIRPGEHLGHQKGVTDDVAAARELMAVPAKHYAVLVTDVEQHPYADPADPNLLTETRELEVVGWPERVALAIFPLRLRRFAFHSFSRTPPRVVLLHPPADPLHGRSATTATAAWEAVLHAGSLAAEAASASDTAVTGSEDVGPAVAGCQVMAEAASERALKEA